MDQFFHISPAGQVIALNLLIFITEIRIIEQEKNSLGMKTFNLYCKQFFNKLLNNLKI